MNRQSNMAPRITISIVTYNSGPKLLRCVEAVFAQTFSAKEVVLVDNRSNDDSLSLVEAAGFPLRVNQNPENLGYAAAHNQLHGTGISDYLLFLNPDAWLSPDFVAKQIAFLDRHPDVAIVGGKLYQDERRTRLDGVGINLARSRRFILRGHGQPDNGQLDAIREVFAVDGAAMTARRRALDQVDWFDESFFLHKEDIDLCWRLRISGWRIMVNPAATAIHPRFFQPGNIWSRRHVSAKIRYSAIRNHLTMMVKNDQWSEWWRDSIWIGARQLAVFGYLLVKEPGGIGALIDFFRRLPNTLSQRKKRPRLLGDRPIVAPFIESNF